jgi:hypothetical protein
VTTNEIDFLMPIAFAIDSAILGTRIAHGHWSPFGSVRSVIAVAIWLVLLVGTVGWLVSRLRRKGD